jgi:hypothetical protein
LSFSDVGKGGDEFIIGELTPCCFGGRHIGGHGRDGAQIGGRVFLAQPLHGFRPIGCEIRSEGGDQLT